MRFHHEESSYPEQHDLARFKPALIVVDMQEDFCPPNGSLAVANGRAVVPAINALLRLPFVLKLATKDWHPASHISFADNHAGKQPFVDWCTVANPLNPAERYETRLWPVHCVQGTPGAELVPELDVSLLTAGGSSGGGGGTDGKKQQQLAVIEKGTDPRVEMYSAFYTPLREPRVGDSGLAARLRGEGITDVFVVGLAADYCVRSTAEDAAAEGFRVYVVEDGTRAVDQDAWEAVGRSALEKTGVRVVGMDGPEVRRVQGLARSSQS